LAIQIRLLESHETVPMDLLLLADPDESIVRSYIRRGQTWVLESEGAVVGVYVLLPTRPKTAELVNVAVAEPMQGQGCGQKLVLHAIATAREQGYGTIEIGTGNSGVAQLYLYQKCGFRIVGVDLDFFTRHYKEPIYENGIWCRDMIRMQLDL